MRRGPVPGSKAVITGGGGDIAREIALRLDALGLHLVLLDVDLPAMQATSALLRQPAELEVVDLSSPGGIRAAADLVEGRHSDLELIVHTAGIVEPGDVVDLDAKWLDAHIHVNLLGAMQLTRSAARAMRPRARGDIVTIVSLAAIAPLPTSARYAASKAGLRAFNISLRPEVAPHGIRVMGVFPGGVDTSMLRHEALHGGSPLAFLGKEPLTTAQVADGVLSALRTGRLETYLPYHDSLTSRAVSAAPWLAERVLPFFSRIGEAGKRRYLERKGLRR